MDPGDTLLLRSRSTVTHVAFPRGSASNVPGGLLEFLWDADHQTLEEAFDKAVRSVTP
jgi:hypothetical protein